MELRNPDNDMAEKLIVMDEEGVHVRSPEIAEKLAKKNISASMITGLSNCAARWLADTFVMDQLVEQEPDNAARRGSLFHKVMEDLFALEPEERTQAAVKKLAVETLHSEEFEDLSDNKDVVEWLKNAINGYYSMGGRPENVNVAEIVMEEAKGPQKGLEIFVKGQIGDAKRPTLGFIDRLILSPKTGKLVIEDWKGLALDTLLPTPDGWTTMGEIQPGDVVYGAQGQEVAVMNKSDVHNRPCYEITFNNGETVICDNVHLWTFNRYWNRTDKDNAVYENDITIDTDELYEKWMLIKDDTDSQIAIRNTQSLQGRKYVQQYSDIRDLVQAIDEFARSGEALPANITQDVTRMLRATIDERIIFMREMMKYYGEVENTFDSGICYFHDPTDDLLIRGIFTELLSTFGNNYRIEEENNSVCFVSSFCPTYPEFFKDYGDVDVSEASIESTYFTKVVNVEKVDSVPTQCIKVDAEDSLYLFGESMTPTHNTGAKMKQWKSHTKSTEGWAEQRQQLIYKILLEQKGFDVSGARLIYPVAQGIVKVDVEDQELLDKVVKDVEEADKALDTMIENNTFEYNTSFLCHWCPLVTICPGQPYVNMKSEKLRNAFLSQPDSNILMRGIDLQ